MQVPCLRNVLSSRAESRTQINAASVPKECLPQSCFRFPVLAPHDSNLKMPELLSRACDLSQPDLRSDCIAQMRMHAHHHHHRTSPQYQKAAPPSVGWGGKPHRALRRACRNQFHLSHNRLTQKEPSSSPETVFSPSANAAHLRQTIRLTTPNHAVQTADLSPTSSPPRSEERG